MKPKTQPAAPASALCPTCQEPHQTFRDATGATFIPRHQKPGRKPCPVTKVQK